jgi:hypothetical protein
MIPGPVAPAAPAPAAAVRAPARAPVRPLPPPEEAAKRLPEPGRCHSCLGSRYWLSRHGVTVCELCHPPVEGAAVAHADLEKGPLPADWLPVRRP